MAIFQRIDNNKTSMKKFLFIAALALFPAFADTVKDREGAVRKDKADMENDRRWIYNDWEHGFDVAKKENKPLLVVLRCVPCLACAGIDASVLNEPELSPLLDHFVCVRVINANALDLTLFQFDYDLSFSTLFFNADRTIYGRFGSWTHQKHSQDKNIAGFRAALESALALHRGYPANKTSLAGKQGAHTPFKSTLEIPALAAKYKRELDWQGKVVQSCVHCHQIGDAMRAIERKQNKTLSRELIYPWPAPETMGLTLAGDAAARVETVDPNTAAAKAGLQAGDQIQTFNGQPLISVADFSWVLNHAPASGPLKATVKRGASEKQITINLPQDWRMKSDIARREAAWPMRAMAFGGIFAEDLSDEERAKRNIDKNSLAILIKHVGEYNEHAAAKKAGFQKNDIIIALDDLKTRATESELIGRILQKHLPGTKLPTTILRGDQKIELQMPVQ
jgi:serine protease Do